VGGGGRHRETVANHRTLTTPTPRRESRAEQYCPESDSPRNDRNGQRRNSHLRQFCDEFRDVAGNPFRPVAFDPAWRTETVVGLATGIDEVGAYERLPVLADALQEVGGEYEQVLTHARGPGPHVRGCWLVDLVQGRFSANTQMGAN